MLSPRRHQQWSSGNICPEMTIRSGLRLNADPHYGERHVATQPPGTPTRCLPISHGLMVLYPYRRQNSARVRVRRVIRALTLGKSPSSARRCNLRAAGIGLWAPVVFGLPGRAAALMLRCRQGAHQFAHISSMPPETFAKVVAQPQWTTASRSELGLD
jgi:hypothetical protein